MWFHGDFCSNNWISGTGVRNFSIVIYPTTNMDRYLVIESVTLLPIALLSAIYQLFVLGFCLSSNNESVVCIKEYWMIKSIFTSESTHNTLVNSFSRR